MTPPETLKRCFGGRRAAFCYGMARWRERISDPLSSPPHPLLPIQKLNSYVGNPCEQRNLPCFSRPPHLLLLSDTSSSQSISPAVLVPPEFGSHSAVSSHFADRCLFGQGGKSISFPSSPFPQDKKRVIVYKSQGVKKGVGAARRNPFCAVCDRHEPPFDLSSSSSPSERRFPPKKSKREKEEKFP